MNPLVSIITPAYNSEKYIGETIESVLAQDYANFELIIINDGSPDNLEDVVLNYAKTDSRIRYSSQENQGMCATRNNAIKVAKGAYFAFLDNDDLWLPDNLSKKIQVLQQHTEIGLVHSDTEVIDGNGNRTGTILQGKSGELLTSLLKWDGTTIPGPSSVLVRRDIHEQVNGFDPDLSVAGDKDYFIRVSSRCHIGRIPEVLTLYRVHENNFHKNVHAMENDERRVLEKNVKNGLYGSDKFRKECFSNTFLIVGKSWLKVRKNPFKGIPLIVKALFLFPRNIFKLI